MRILTGQGLDMEFLWDVAQEQTPVSLSPKARESMESSLQWVQNRLAHGEVMYGVNTGFGHFSHVVISKDQTLELQKNLIRSHCVGVGEPFSVQQTRAILLLRANALARGHSGVRPQVVEKIIEFLNQNVIPVVPSQGSVGASGDLAPLAHVALGLMGEGFVWCDGKQEPMSEILAQKSIKPLEPQAKEGLSLINGCQVMTAVGLMALKKARSLLWISDLCGAMTLEALRGSRRAFHPLISATRPHRGEGCTARNLLKILDNTSPIGQSHRDCEKVQDAYSLRCMPAVHGAAKEALKYVHQVLTTEANSSTDNPLVFAKEGEVLSCGNFHGEVVAQALDFGAIGLSGLANISERRIEKMMNPATSGLPAFLTSQGGLNSGHMIVQVVAASLVSENKILSHPASVDSIPTSADKEDHVSMGCIAARKFSKVVENSQKVLAMELLASCQALDLLKPLESSEIIQAVHGEIRKVVPMAQRDRVFSQDVETINKLIEGKSILDLLGHLEW